MTKPKFFTRDGWLTRYALACGYKHSQRRADKQEVELTCVNNDLPLYLVRRYDGAAHTFESFSEDLRTARAMFKMAMGERLKQRWEDNPDVARPVYC